MRWSIIWARNSSARNTWRSIPTLIPSMFHRHTCAALDGLPLSCRQARQLGRDSVDRRQVGFDDASGHPTAFDPLALSGALSERHLHALPVGFAARFEPDLSDSVLICFRYTSLSSDGYLAPSGLTPSPVRVTSSVLVQAQIFLARSPLPRKTVASTPVQACKSNGRRAVESGSARQANLFPGARHGYGVLVDPVSRMLPVGVLDLPDARGPPDVDSQAPVAMAPAGSTSAVPARQLACPCRPAPRKAV